jgi:hypothetical protein
MSSVRNPFQSLYVTERVNELNFPAIFSPTLIPVVLPLFQAGNVMLSGTQGTGKSMLLALLDSEIRISFWNSSANPYPVEAEFCRFVGANINLSTSLVTKFNERKFSSDRTENIARSQAAFSDYFNTWVIRDLLESINTLVLRAPSARLQECGVKASAATLDSFAKNISSSDECGVLLKGVGSYAEAIAALTQRLRVYLDFINFKTDQIADSIQSSLTGIGEPISALSRLLKETGLLDRGTEVFVTVDQCEELLRLEQSDTEEEEHGRFRKVLDKVISSREKAVSYRLGTRPNAIWKGKSEEVRDYIKVDLDLLFNKKEHSKGLFPKFAEDVFVRRLQANALPLPESQPDVLNGIFSASLSATERAKKCTPEKRPERVLKTETNWPVSVKSKLVELVKSDPLSAKLGEAWFRQASAKASSESKVPLAERERALQELQHFDAGTLPWEDADRRWWKKERIGQAILQIAARNAQRIPYSGKRDILALSGKNILVFALICQKIWEAWIQQTDANAAPATVPHPFPKWRQDEGIRAASEVWHSKISSAPNADTVRRLIDELGNRLRRQLRNDKPMSYPGANGISLRNVELVADPEVKELLDHATAEGFLQVSKHTSKSPSRGHSQKWYTHPILAPYYELTVAHTKEPLYISVAKLRSWLEGADVLEKRSTPTPKQVIKRESIQRGLFDEIDE